MTELTIELLPCPFCGSKNVGLYYPYLKNDPKSFVTCQDCCADGPATINPEKAWNQRSEYREEKK